jgi:multidrug transporter EmrE-like cation transporter
MQEHYEQWNRKAPLGLICIGAGLSLVTHAAALKNRGQSFWVWGVLGTIGLVIANSGIALFGDSVKHRALYEAAMERLKS